LDKAVHPRGYRRGSTGMTADAKCEVCHGWLIFRAGKWMHRDTPNRGHAPKPDRMVAPTSKRGPK